ncbi:MAG TPA: hypothetical protein VKU02_15440 [Gemmataceae bacterium]|nr:hypothetical protein [Gemmataceae bacterium]
MPHPLGSKQRIEFRQELALPQTGFPFGPTESLLQLGNQALRAGRFGGLQPALFGCGDAVLDSILDGAKRFWR